LSITLPLETGIIYFVTGCTRYRREIFVTDARVKMVIAEIGASRDRLRWLVGGVVVMPDHFHLFCSPLDRQDHDLSRFTGAWRSAVSRKLKQDGVATPIWQKSFHDHLLRSDESYGNKWDYVRSNPERAALNDFQRWFELDRLER